MTQVQSGDMVQVHYTGRLTGGAVFGTSRMHEPVEFTAGGQQMIEGLSQAVLGMQVGETKSITVAPEQGFGPREPGLQHRVRRRELPGNVKVGDLLLAEAAGYENFMRSPPSWTATTRWPARRCSSRSKWWGSGPPSAPPEARATNRPKAQRSRGNNRGRRFSH